MILNYPIILNLTKIESPPKCIKNKQFWTNFFVVNTITELEKVVVVRKVIIVSNPTYFHLWLRWSFDNT